MEFWKQIEILKRRKWVLLLTAIVAIAGVGLGSYLTAPVYSASAVVRIAQIQDREIGYYDLSYQVRLINTYVHLLESRPFLVEVIERLGLNVSPEDLADRIEVEALVNTELLKIAAESEDPILAMEIANALGVLLIEQRETLYSGQGKSAREILSDQLAIVEQNLTEDRARLQGLLSDVSDPDGDGAIQDATARVQVQEQTYTMLLDQYERARLSEAARASSIGIVEPAIAPELPSRPNMILNITIGALIGLSGGIGLSFVFENLDQSAYSASELEEATQLPVLGSIPRFHVPKGLQRPVLLKADNQSAAGEAFRVLRTNILAFCSREGIRTILIASAEPEAGKSTVLANLALAIVKSGRKVAIVDSDFRAPRLHEVFGKPNNWGLSTMIMHPRKASSAISLAKTTLQNLFVIPSGPLPLNPGELIGSFRVKELLEGFAGEVDVVLLDSPAILAFADAASLAPMVEGVVIVGARGQASARNAQRAVDQMNKVGASLIGVVFNKAETRELQV